MGRMLVLVAVLGLATFPAIAAPPGEKSSLETATGHKQGYEKTVSAPSQEPSWGWCRRASLRWGVRREIQMNDRHTRSIWMPFPSIGTKCR